MNLLEFLLSNRAEILTAKLEHLWLVGWSMLIAAAIGLPLGILITRWPSLNRPILGGANVVQTIPSLALFGFLLPLPWVGDRGDRLAITALAAYALLPIIRNTYKVILSVNTDVRETACDLKMNEHQLILQMELQLALGVILAGIRVATVLTVGVATIAAAIGAGGLGEFIFRGLAMVNNQLILAGAIPAALLALFADFALGQLERLLRKNQ
jgi:osmoprotectant transport system permease protein